MPLCVVHTTRHHFIRSAYFFRSFLWQFPFFSFSAPFHLVWRFWNHAIISIAQKFVPTTSCEHFPLWIILPEIRINSNSQWEWPNCVLSCCYQFTSMYNAIFSFKTKQEHSFRYNLFRSWFSSSTSSLFWFRCCSYIFWVPHDFVHWNLH